MSLYEKMIKLICEELMKYELEVVGIENVLKTVENKETGVKTEELQSKIELEVPRGCGSLAKTRLTVRTPQSSVTRLIIQKSLEDEIIKIKPIDLQISFIDQKRNVYFKCSRIEICKEG